MKYICKNGGGDIQKCTIENLTSSNSSDKLSIKYETNNSRYFQIKILKVFVQ